MTRYKVLKEFIDRDGMVCGRGARNELSVDKTIDNDEYLMFYQMLENEGYIEEIEEGAWSRGVKIPANVPFWKLRTRGDTGVECVNNVASYDVALGLAFRTEEEAKAYAEHLRLENVLINITVGDHDADLKFDKNYPTHMSPEIVIKGYGNFYFTHVFFPSRDSADFFVMRNMDALRDYFSYYFKEGETE